MMQFSAHFITKIELVRRFKSNFNSRTIRITHTGDEGNEEGFELVLYGETDVLDGLPKSSDFRECE